MQNASKQIRYLWKYSMFFIALKLCNQYHTYMCNHIQVAELGLVGWQTGKIKIEAFSALVSVCAFAGICSLVNFLSVIAHNMKYGGRRLQLGAEWLRSAYMYSRFTRMAAHAFGVVVCVCMHIAQLILHSNTDRNISCTSASLLFIRLLHSANLIVCMQWMLLFIYEIVFNTLKS